MVSVTSVPTKDDGVLRVVLVDVLGHPIAYNRSWCMSVVLVDVLGHLIAYTTEIGAWALFSVDTLGHLDAHTKIVHLLFLEKSICEILQDLVQAGSGIMCCISKELVFQQEL